MIHEYGRFQCRLCGEQVFVLLPSPMPTNGQREQSFFELTCSNGHTDSYELSQLESVSAKPAMKLKVRRAALGVG